MDKQYMYIDGAKVEINGEKNVLEVARKAGIEIPAFCYDAELSVYGACRMCVVENEWGGIDASCSMVPKSDMKIKTNTPKLRKYRKMVLELLLANHCRDCTVCIKSGKCKLQEFALKFGLTDVRFPNNVKTSGAIDKSSVSITRDSSKCILCGKCVRTCEEIQSVGAIGYGYRGSKMKIVTAFDKGLVDSPCVGCGQCAKVCPTGAIVIKNDVAKVWDCLSDDGTEVSVQVAPAVRVALGKEFGLNPADDFMGKLVNALRKLGFNKVYDTSLGADMTTIEESNEFLNRLKNGGKFPMFTSCCPAWIRFVENDYPAVLENISTCRSPMEMFASTIKESYEGDKKHVHVAIMPCTAKKFEAQRDEFKDKNGNSYVDYVLTTQEIIGMIKTAGIDFASLAVSELDDPYAMITGSGVLFGVTGGVTESVLRYVLNASNKDEIDKIAFIGVRGLEGIKEATVNIGERELKFAIVSGLANARVLIEKIKKGEAYYDLIEVMSCPGGCINGAGQPVSEIGERSERSKGIYCSDVATEKKSANQNIVVKELLAGKLKGKEHEILHVHYKKR